MLDEDLLRDEFSAILEAKRRSAEWLANLLRQVDDPHLRESIAVLQSHAARQVHLSERLVEIVS